MSLTDEINALSDKILALEQENERLKAQPAPNPAAEEFIRLMAPHMAPIEAKFDEQPSTTLAESMCELVRVYRKAKEGI